MLHNYSKMTLGICLGVAVLIGLGAGSARAQHLHGPVGLGLVLGEPTGIAAKVFLAGGNAVEAAAAWSLSGNNEFQLQGDYVFHMWDWIKVEQGQMPVTFGVGGRIKFRENRDDIVGVRFPIGLAYELDQAPIDFFGQLVPILDLAPDTDFDLEGAIGARFYFGQ